MTRCLCGWDNIPEPPMVRAQGHHRSTPEEKLNQLDQLATGDDITQVEQEARRQANLDTMSGEGLIGLRWRFLAAVCGHRPTQFVRVLRNKPRVVIRKWFGAFDAVRTRFLARLAACGLFFTSGGAANRHDPNILNR